MAAARVRATRGRPWKRRAGCGGGGSPRGPGPAGAPCDRGQGRGAGGARGERAGRAEERAGAQQAGESAGINCCFRDRLYVRVIKSEWAEGGSVSHSGGSVAGSHVVVPLWVAVIILVMPLSPLLSLLGHPAGTTTRRVPSGKHGHALHMEYFGVLG